MRVATGSPSSASWSLPEIAALSGGRLESASEGGLGSVSGGGPEGVSRSVSGDWPGDVSGDGPEDVSGDVSESGPEGRAELSAGGIRIAYRAISTDTRTLRPGDLFVALRGENHDGHDHLGAAIEGGAVALFVDHAERASGAPEGEFPDTVADPVPRAAGVTPGASPSPVPNASPNSAAEHSPNAAADVPPPSRVVPRIRVDDTLVGWQRWGASHRAGWSGGPLVAVTGSSGKTTTKNALAHLLSGLGPVWATSGNRNNHIGVPWTLLGLSEEHRFAVIEMGMNSTGEIRRLSLLARPDLALVTSIGRAHIGMLGSREAILQAKLEITDGLAETGTLVLPHDTWVLRRLPEELKGRPRVTFGLSPEADWSPSGEVVYSASGTHFRTEKTGDIDLCLLGGGAVLSALAALATVDALGLDVRALAPRLAELRAEPMRMEPRRWGIHPVIVDCYNASPESTRLAIDFLGSVAHDGRKILVLGELSELGDETEAIHREIVRSIQNVDLVLLVGPALAEIAEEAEQYPGAGQVVWRAMREDASTWLAETLEAGDLVLLKASRRLALERILERPAPGPLSREED